jgi:FAD/FMN-containing dehydrogenase
LSVVSQLESEVRGSVLHPGSAEYDEARRVYNGMIDRRPQAILRCAHVDDVVAGVGFGRQNGLIVAIRGGGHNVAGNAVCDGGLVIDLGGLRGVKVDPAARRATCEGGATWGELDRATQAHGLAMPGGIISSTGVAGLTLGGGIGTLRGLYGLTSDNLLAATVVTADGRVVRAGEGGDADLLWGLRGGGGNFGVVTSFEFDVHPVGQVVAGPLEVPQSERFLDFYRGWLESLPDGASCDIIFRRSPSGDPTFLLLFFHAGPPEEAARILAPLRERFRPADAVAVRSYVESQCLYDAGSPWGQRNYWKSNGMSELSDAAAQTLLERFAEIPSPLCVIGMEYLHGRIHSGVSGAVSFKSARFDLLIESKWLDPAEDETNVAWTRDTWAAMQPHTAGGAYVNYLGLEPQERVRAAYGDEVYSRLVALKDRYDPENFFRMNQNIKPSKEVGRDR